MKAVTFHGERDVRVERVEDPRIQHPADVIIRVTTGAICGSDLHLYHNAIPGLLPGHIIGHEYVGVVEEVGSQVTAFRKGERVVGAFHVACGRCRMCRREAYNQCEHGGVLGYGIAFGDLAGTQAEYARIPFADTTLRRVPDGLTDEQALFSGDILTTAYGAVANSGLQPGETVAVIGCGPVGIMAVQSALAMGASKVFAVDLVRERTDLAEKLGAVPVPSGEVNPSSRILNGTDGEGVDVVIEAVGGSPTLKLAFELVRGGGRISAVGVTAEDTFAYPLMNSLTKDVTFRIGLANIHRDMDATLALVRGGRIDPTVVVSHRLPLSQAAEGYRLFDKREASKVILDGSL
ncbi:threonine dehydrogenase-like Zn-dependent dehydrogenase [Melghirimyces profundicolus]|uniref:Threonine dehydrogenase-like Zn-dependent dehydrogenase n=1 Tax=Melghirimyces profundicolus TaxID=1242148 RepID=A0A2T6BXH6_9BACL|nr:alcohol dehydrogenase family protein [Melghirimyces profundicolus]PTX60774.1 threonine dehydrogenase-like Zn-dependent dehydrogenase [Melghirimyces profundicolus]